MRKKWNFIVIAVIAAFLCTAMLLGAKYAFEVTDAFLITKF